jgi:alpha-galactosidase
MSLVLPPEVCNRIAGWLSSSDERFGDIDTQLRVAILGHPTLFGVAPSTDEVPPLHRKRIEHAVGLYKSRIRPMLATSRVFHHTPEFEFERPFGYLALEYAAPDGLGGVAGVFRLAKAEDSYTFTPRGLDRGRRYRVTLDNNGQSYLADGASLADQGITVRVSGPLGSELILFVVED